MIVAINMSDEKLISGSLSKNEYYVNLFDNLPEAPLYY